MCQDFRLKILSRESWKEVTFGETKKNLVKEFYSHESEILDGLLEYLLQS